VIAVVAGVVAVPALALALGVPGEAPVPVDAPTHRAVVVDHDGSAAPEDMIAEMWDHHSEMAGEMQSHWSEMAGEMQSHWNEMADEMQAHAGPDGGPTTGDHRGFMGGGMMGG